MSEANIITSQFVKIDQTPASVGERIFARIIDYAVLFVYYFAMGMFIALTAAHVSFAAIILIIPVFYSFLCETFYSGQTLGKHLLKIRVVKKDGTQPGIGDLFMRWLLLIVDVWFSFAGIIAILVTKNYQRFGDLAAGTMVIKIADYKKVHVSIDEFYYARKDYKPLYPEVANLSLGQIDIIEKVLKSDYDEYTIDSLTQKVKKVMGIETIKDRNQTTFLTTVLHDYQFLATELI